MHSLIHADLGESRIAQKMDPGEGAYKPTSSNYEAMTASLRRACEITI